MIRPVTFNQRTPRVEAQFIALTKIFFAKQKKIRTHSIPSSGRVFVLLAAAVELIMFERRLYRIIAAYNTLLIQFPPIDSAETHKRMETLSFFIRNIQEIVNILGSDAEYSMERRYLARVCGIRDSLVLTWDVYADTTNAELISRIKDVAVNYLPQQTTHM